MSSMADTIAYMKLRRAGHTHEEIYEACAKSALDEAESLSNKRKSEFLEKIEAVDGIFKITTYEAERENLKTLRQNRLAQEKGVDEATTRLNVAVEAIEKQKYQVISLKEAVASQLHALENPPTSKDAKKVAAFFRTNAQESTK